MLHVNDDADDVNGLYELSVSHELKRWQWRFFAAKFLHFWAAVALMIRAVPHAPLGPSPPWAADSLGPRGAPLSWAQPFSWQTAWIIHAGSSSAECVWSPSTQAHPCSTHTHAHTHTYTHTETHLGTDTHGYTRSHMCKFTVNTKANTRTQSHVLHCMHTSTHTNLLMYAHTHTQKHTLSCTQLG